MRWGRTRNGSSPDSLSPAPGDGWYHAVAAMLETEDAAVVRRPHVLLRALAEADPPYQWGSRPAEAFFVGRANVDRAVDLIRRTGRINNRAAATYLGPILLRAVSQHSFAQSARVRDACAAALVDTGTPQAVFLLTEAAGQAPNEALREQLLRRARSAKSRVNWPSRRDEFHISHHHLSKRGRRALFWYGRRFMVRMLPDGDVRVTRRGVEVPVDLLPEHSRVVDLWYAVPRTYRSERFRIEALLASGRDWAPREWARVYLGNPITRAVAARLIWRRTYRDGRVMDVLPGWGGGNVVSLAADGTPWSGPANPIAPYRVSLWHPSDAEPAALARWREACGNLRQPFDQLHRRFYRVPPESVAAELLTLYTGAVVHEDEFRRAVSRSRGDWTTYRGPSQAYVDAAHAFYRHFPDDGLRLTVSYTQSAGPTGTIVLGAAWFCWGHDDSDTRLRLGALPPRVYSEAMKELRSLVRASLVENSAPGTEFQMPKGEDV